MSKEDRLNGLLHDIIYRLKDEEVKEELIDYVDELIHIYNRTYDEPKNNIKVHQFTRTIMETVDEFTDKIETFLDEEYDPDNYHFDIQWIMDLSDIRGAVVTVYYHG